MDVTVRESLTRRVSVSNRHRTKIDDLRDAWHRSSDRTSWAQPDGWWTPAVDALILSVLRGSDLREPCARLGRARAEAGLGLGQTIDDLAALYRLLRSGTPPTSLIRILVDAWSRAQAGRHVG